MAPRHGSLRTKNPASPGCQVQDTLPVSIWPNLKFTGSTSHLPWKCEKHSLTFIRSGRFASHATQIFQGQRDLPLHSPPPAARVRHATHMHVHSSYDVPAYLVCLHVSMCANQACLCCHVRTCPCPSMSVQCTPMHTGVVCTHMYMCTCPDTRGHTCLGTCPCTPGLHTEAHATTPTLPPDPAVTEALGWGPRVSQDPARPEGHPSSDPPAPTAPNSDTAPASGLGLGLQLSAPQPVCGRTQAGASNTGSSSRLWCPRPSWGS